MTIFILLNLNRIHWVFHLEKNKKDSSNLFVIDIDEQTCQYSKDIIIGSHIIKLENEYVEGKGHKNISKILKRKYYKTLPLKITFKKPNKSKPDNIIKPIRSQTTNLENTLCKKQRHERRKSEPLTPSSMDSKPLTPSKQTSKTRTVSMGFNIRKEYLLKTGHFPEVAVNKKNRTIQFKKREYKKHGTLQFNKRKFKIPKANGSVISISESNSDGLLFRGCDVSKDSKKKKKKSEILKKKKKKARPRSESVHQNKNKKKVKVKNVRSKRAQSDVLNKQKKIKKKTKIAVKSNKKKKKLSKQSSKKMNVKSSKQKKKIIKS